MCKPQRNWGLCQNKNFGNDFIEAIQLLEQPVMPKPRAKPALGVDAADDADVRIWERKLIRM